MFICIYEYMYTWEGGLKAQYLLELFNSYVYTLLHRITVMGYCTACVIIHIQKSSSASVYSVNIFARFQYMYIHIWKWGAQSASNVYVIVSPFTICYTCLHYIERHFSKDVYVFSILFLFYNIHISFRKDQEISFKGKQ
jgi:hypothetical protein